MTALEEIGISGENVELFIKTVSEEAFILEDVAKDLGISESAARIILQYIIDRDIIRFKQVWVPVKKYELKINERK